MRYAPFPLTTDLLLRNVGKIKDPWRTGDFSYKLKPRPAQIEMRRAIYKNKSLKYVINSSRRLGKTFLLCILGCEKAIKKKNAQIRFGAPEQMSLRKIIHPIMTEICMDAPPEARPVWRRDDSMYLFPETGSTMHVSGCNGGHCESLRGNSADLILVDEAREIDDLKYVVDDILMPQLIGREDVQLIMASTSPRTPAHDFTSYAQQAMLTGNYSEYNFYQSGYDQETIARFIEEAGGMESSTCKREYFCKFVVDEDLALAPEWSDLYIRAHDEKDPLKPLYTKLIWMDIGFKDLTALLFAHYDFKQGKLFVEDEIIMSGKEITTKNLADRIAALDSILWRGGTDKRSRISDNNNLILLNDLGAMHGMHFVPTSKDTLEAMVNEVRLWVAAGRIIVNPKCQNLIGCLRYGIWNEKRTDFAKTSAYGHFDAFAALMYGVRNVDQQTNPIPLDFGFSKADLFISDGVRDGTSNTENAVKDMFGLK